MAILKNVSLYFCKLDPKKPVTNFNPDGQWEIQIRTSSKAQAKEWKDLGVKVKTDEEDGKIVYKANLKKKAMKKDPEDDKKLIKAAPVKVVNGMLEEIDPTTIGNGSIGNVRLFQYEYKAGKGKDGKAIKAGTANMLMEIQLTKHIVYVRPPREDDFEQTDTETIVGEGLGDEEPEDLNESKSSGGFDDMDDDIPF